MDRQLKILVLAGGSDQCALIKELQSRGHEVILLDYLDNPLAKAIVKQHIKLSTLDVNAVKDVAVQECVDLICTACTDQALLTVASVSEDLGLPCYISYTTARNVTNKTYMKRLMVENSIPTSRYYELNSIDCSALNQLEFPLVVKPADCNSSKGVIKVKNKDEFKVALSDALILSRTHTAIVEEFVEGEEISADFYIDDYNPIYLSATTSFKVKSGKGFTILGSSYTPPNDEEKIALTDIARKIAIAFDLANTPLLIQLIKSEDKYYVIEFSARMGGGSKYHLIQQISNVNIMSKYVDLILGDKPVILPSINPNYIKMIYVYTKPGVVMDIKGIEELINNQIIEQFFLYKSIGSEITKAETSSDRILGYLIVAESDEELSKKASIANTQIEIINEAGKDIMLHNLL